MIVIIDFFVGQPVVLQALIATGFTYFVTALGAGTVFVFKTVNQKVLNFMMGMAGGVMIAASFWSLLAPAIELASELGDNAWLTAAVGFALGGLFVMGANILLSKIDYIHQKGSGFRRSVLLVSAVTLHNIPEGMAVGVAFGCAALGVPGSSILSAMMLGLGIGLQNFPEGVCVAMPLRREGVSRLKSFALGQASGMVEPIAGVLGVLFALSMRSMLPLALTFSAGAMIAVVCSELVPESFRENKNIAGLGVIFGFIVMMVLDVALG